jgi:hypothetical protein
VSIKHALDELGRQQADLLAALFSRLLIAKIVAKLERASIPIRDKN